MDRRSYNQQCGLACALDLVGERWTMLVVRNLLLGPLRYSDLLRGLPGITTNLLAKRLREMEELGLIERVRGASDAGHTYRLTAFGMELEPAVHALGRWGWKAPRTTAHGKHRSFDWLLVALRRRYRGGRALRAEIVADDVPYRIVLSKDHAEIARGVASSPQLRMRGPANAIAELFLDDKTRRRIPSSIKVEGSADVQTLLDAFATEELS